MANPHDDSFYQPGPFEAQRISQQAHSAFKALEPITSRLADVDHRLQEIDAHLRDLETRRQMLELERAPIQAEFGSKYAMFKELRRPLHPIRRTPPEIIGAIFELCLEDSTAHAPISMELPFLALRQKTPFRLAAVCRAWRHASLLCPRAWRVVEIRLDPVEDAVRDAQLRYVNMALHRSGSAGLSVRVARGAVALVPPIFDYTTLLEPFVLNAHRIESLLVLVELTPSPTDPICGLLSTPMPALRNLYYVPTQWDGWERSESRQFFADSPRLASLHTRFATIGPFTDVGKAIRNAPDLHTLSIHRPTFNSAPSTPFVHEGVSELLVTHRDSLHERGSLAVLSQHMRFPNLRNLHMHGSDGSAAARIAFFVELAQQGAPLRHVMLYDVGPNFIEGICTGLKHCTKLHSFSLVGARFNVEALTRFVELLTMPYTPVRTDGEEDEEEQVQEHWVSPELYALRLSKCAWDESCDMMELPRFVQRRRELNRAAQMSMIVSPAKRPVLLRKFHVDKNPTNTTTTSKDDRDRDPGGMSEGNKDPVTPAVRRAIQLALKDVPF
ncbi:hypothetical protein BKA62DRAFT_695828 [Auriculariales sp. MPI-PUGE-AT-0066]|nr:hypothetical protein BKA62DRAFT_695828 [Auriculariales sp. MPI-PUGE-AT-0066]